MATQIKARYTVKVIAGERSDKLLVLLDSTQPCSALVDTIRLRLKDTTLNLSEADATLHLEEPDGPMLYLADTLADVLPGAKETVVVVFQVKNANNPIQSPQHKPQSGERTLKIRVISPEQARSGSIDTIPPLQDALPLNSTLKELRAHVQQHLGYPADDGTCPELECNCNLARQIDEHATFNEEGAEVFKASHTVIVVHGNNEVVARPINSTTSDQMQEIAKEFMVHPSKILKLVGGVRETSGPLDSRQYIKLPVLAICSKDGHLAKGTSREGTGATREYRELIVDLHTSECPIEITAHNANTTLVDAGLDDCAIGGVLNIYAVQRWTHGQIELGHGKAGIFKKSDAWEHPHGQSDRGIANLLSTLRVFANLTAGRAMEDVRQDAVLHMIYLLTRYPPAVRATYILMRGETPRNSERAALAQCLYEVLKVVVPMPIVGSDPHRLFEGTRLLFGLILEKAKNLKLSKGGPDVNLPYVGMKVHDLRNKITMEPVLSTPVQTNAGLLDLGFYQAFQPGGLLVWTNAHNTAKVSRLDNVWSRVATLSGGTKAQVVGFDLDAIRSSTRYADRNDIGAIISPAELSELSYLASLCSRNELNVIAPSALPSATPPVLTLDREGSLAVYIGRKGCGGPGDDILMFRPTTNREEDSVDVSVVTQVLEPILARRRADGTAVFEAYGDQHRKVTAPDEIIMLCVDLSSSMGDRCGFVDVQDNEDDDAQLQLNRGATVSDSTESNSEDPAFPLPDVDELKEFLKAHESFDDMVAIIRSGKEDYQRRRNAEKVLEIVQQIDSQQIEAKRKRLDELRLNASHYALRTQAYTLERDLGALRNRSLRVQRHKNLLCAWLLTLVGHGAAIPDPLAWKPGDAIPVVPQAPGRTVQSGPKFEVPHDLCCHISSEVMDDPVITVDNYTYERKNIERWFQTNETSPLTNLVLNSLDLRSNTQKKGEIAAWISGSDITSRYKNLRGDSGMLRVSIKSPLNTWSLLLPRNLKQQELWELSFRLTKGRYTQFELQHRNSRLAPSQQSIGASVNTDHPVFITPLETTPSSARNDATEELCLVKVYHDSSYDRVIASFWEPKKTTRSLASVVFRYYRQKFMMNNSTTVDKPFAFWTGLRNIGDNHLRGTVLDGPWQPLSRFFTRSSATGSLKDESCVDMGDEADDDMEDDSSDQGFTVGTSDRPLVFKVALGRPSQSAAKRTTTLSRLDVLKQMFDAFINRLLAYNFQTHIGLITFGTTASVSQDITNAVENFRHQLNNMSAKGDTAVWDSLALAHDQLQHYGDKYPTAKLRVICISDGEDNKSKQNVVDVTSRLRRQNILVDSFCLGNALNDDLMTVSHLTGGYIFEPKTLDEAMAICELEPVLSSLERPETRSTSSSRSKESSSLRRFSKNPSLNSFRLASYEVSVQRVSQDVFPKRKEHPQLSESFVELGTFAKHSAQTRTDGNLRLSRIHSEIRNSGANPHPDYDIYICEPNMGFWKVVMQGPPGSTYAGGAFMLYIDMGADYPMFAPTARFSTPIYHPNINRHGRICHSILDRNWTVDTSNKDLIDTIYSLLLVPEFSDPINTVVTLNYHWDEVQFKEEAQKHIRKHASKSRAAWRKEIVG
ncbi:hypothetical protein FB567DRAFT_346883 [Paraphoma chrysanthemicola]|uniref:peptidylprolyl isomerase n=1 Tax=Paraphoma chrysanthemicola TaxID=798071 RepID=A0A8K0VYS0_9PLEO|nr:hypothetical protein FB567DRAFT_346883 [Paraphoma chrysanthemicola]